MKTIQDNDTTIQVQLLDNGVKLEIQAPKLTPEEEEKLIDEINDVIATKNKSGNKLRPLVHALDVGLGGGCLREYFKIHFDKNSKSDLYKEVQAARAEAIVSPTSQIGEITRSVLLQLAKLKNPEDQLTAWKAGILLCKAGQKYPIETIMLDIVKAAYHNGAEVSDPRVERSFKVSDEEKLKKRAGQFLKKLKLDLEKLNAEAQLNILDVCQKIDELGDALSKVYNIESITSIGSKPEPETVIDAISSTPSDLVEGQAVTLTKVTAMPLQLKPCQALATEKMLKIKLPNQKHPKLKKIARNEQKPIFLKGKLLNQSFSLLPEEIKLMIPKSSIPIANSKTFFPDNFSCSRGFDFPVLNIEFPPDVA